MSKNSNTVSFIPITRSFFDHFLWREKRTFSKCEAWLDLIQSARFEQSQATELIGGRLIKWSRGQLPASVRFLEKRWNWGKHKVEDFLMLLEKEKMIVKDASQGQNIITLLNYDEHNSKKEAKGQQRGQQEQPPQGISEEEGDTKGDIEGTAGGQSGDKTNNLNKGNKEEQLGDVPPPPKSFKQWDEEDFINEVNAFAESFTEKTIKDFTRYWKEKTPKGKMKFQLQQTWETNLRLETWASKEIGYSQKNTNNGTHLKPIITGNKQAGGISFTQRGKELFGS